VPFQDLEDSLVVLADQVFQEQLFADWETLAALNKAKVICSPQLVENFATD